MTATDRTIGVPTFHHFYAFCAPGGAIGDRLLSAGLTELPGRRHAGQGTANRIFPFRQGFLELIWIDSLEEVMHPRTAPLGLHDRSRALRSPFGLAVKVPNFSDLARPPFAGWDYRPLYLSDGGFIWIAANGDFPGEPMLFSSPFFGDPPGRQDAPELDKIELTLAPGPSSESLKWIRQKAPLWFATMTAAASPRAVVHLRADRRQSVDLGPEIPLRLELWPAIPAH